MEIEIWQFWFGGICFMGLGYSLGKAIEIVIEVNMSGAVRRHNDGLRNDSNRTRR
jgi:hypothetical protein